MLSRKGDDLVIAKDFFIEFSFEDEPLELLISIFSLLTTLWMI